MRKDFDSSSHAHHPFLIDAPEVRSVVLPGAINGESLVGNQGISRTIFKRLEIDIRVTEHGGLQ